MVCKYCCLNVGGLLVRNENDHIILSVEESVHKFKSGTKYFGWIHDGHWQGFVKTKTTIFIGLNSIMAPDFFFFFA